MPHGDLPISEKKQVKCFVNIQWAAPLNQPTLLSGHQTAPAALLLKVGFNQLFQIKSQFCLILSLIKIHVSYIFKPNAKLEWQIILLCWVFPATLIPKVKECTFTFFRKSLWINPPPPPAAAPQSDANAVKVTSVLSQKKTPITFYRKCFHLFCLLWTFYFPFLDVDKYEYKCYDNNSVIRIEGGWNSCKSSQVWQKFLKAEQTEKKRTRIKMKILIFEF